MADNGTAHRLAEDLMIAAAKVKDDEGRAVMARMQPEYALEIAQTVLGLPLVPDEPLAVPRSIAAMLGARK